MPSWNETTVQSLEASCLGGGRVAAEESWPSDGIEAVTRCPVCESVRRRVLYSELQDRVCFSAPAKWSLKQCEDCGSGYLDPRPTKEYIPLAYLNYFTHVPSALQAPKPGSLAWFRKALANGYRNFCYGTDERPAFRIGVLAAHLFPRYKADADKVMRNLSRPGKSGNRLLDIGCGNGGFLSRAKSLGWDPVGIDVDEGAVKAARGLGLDVRCGEISMLDPRVEQFDAVMMSQVIEHVHDPIGLLRAVFQLIKPYGWLWIDTPNIGSIGHETYAEDWRGLEPPRHLVLFTPASLKCSLEKVGFQLIHVEPYRRDCEFTFAASGAIAANRNPWLEPRLDADARRRVREAERIARSDASKREFIILRAVKSI